MNDQKLRGMLAAQDARNKRERQRIAEQKKSEQQHRAAVVAMHKIAGK